MQYNLLYFFRLTHNLLNLLFLFDNVSEDVTRGWHIPTPLATYHEYINYYKVSVYIDNYINTIRCLYKFK